MVKLPQSLVLLMAVVLVWLLGVDSVLPTCDVLWTAQGGSLSGPQLLAAAEVPTTPLPSLPAQAGFAVGTEAPDIAGEDLTGAPFKLSDYRGKVVVLDFWGDW